LPTKVAINWTFLPITFRRLPACSWVYDRGVKPLPAPPVPGKTEAERFDNAIRKTFTVSKEEMQRREAEWQKAQGKRTLPKKG
jgi:hypothetical protein